jgi:exosortase
MAPAQKSRERDPVAQDPVGSPTNQVPGKTVRMPLRPAVFCGIVAVSVATLLSYAEPLARLTRLWTNEADYSHGFLVPVFAAFLLWHRREMFGEATGPGSWWGLALIAVAGVMRWTATYYFYPLLDAPSLLPCLAGVTLLVGGMGALKWAWPSIAFLVFMIPLPSGIAGLLSNPLQRIATSSSTWLLQTLGVPAMARGNVIWLTNGQIGVVEACSGLRMLMLFAAITVGASFLVQRPLWEKVLISLSAMVIGLFTNILRISVTAILYEYVGAELADKVFHDLAGWLMMPAATLLLILELYVLSKLLVVRPAESSPVLMQR